MYYSAFTHTVAAVQQTATRYGALTTTIPTSNLTFVTSITQIFSAIVSFGDFGNGKYFNQFKNK